MAKGVKFNSRGCSLTLSRSFGQRVLLRSSTSRSWRRACGDFAERPARKKARSDGESCQIYIRLKTKPITDAIGIVQSAQIELKTTGTLSPAAYTAVLAEIRRIQACGPQSEEEIILAEPKIDNQFLLLLERCRKLLEMALEGGHPELCNFLSDSAFKAI